MHLIVNKLISFLKTNNFTIKLNIKSKIFFYSRVSNPKLVPSMLKNLTYLTNLYFANYSPEDEELIKNLQETLNYHNLTAHEALSDITPECHLVTCIWKGRSYECDAMFSKFLTPEGVCCSFNSFALKNWTFQG